MTTASGYRMLDRAALPEGAWDRLVDESDDAWLMHRSAYLDAVAVWPGRKDISVGVVDREGALAAVLPLHRVTLREGRVLRYRQLVSQGGPALDPATRAADECGVLDALRGALPDLLRQHRAVDVEVSGAPLSPRARSGSGTAPLTCLGLVRQDTATWVTDLRGGDDAVWAGLQGRARTTIRKATKAGVTVRVAEDADLDVYYGLHVTTYRRTGRPPHPRAYFEQIWSRFRAGGMACVLLAEHGGQVVAAQNFAIFKQAALYWTGASDEVGLRLGANTLLQWEAMRHAAGRGAEWFENGEAGVDPGKARRLSEFKRSFGGDLWLLPKGRLTRPSAATVLRAGMRHARRLQRSVLPGGSDDQE